MLKFPETAGTLVISAVLFWTVPAFAAVPAPAGSAAVPAAAGAVPVAAPGVSGAVSSTGVNGAGSSPGATTALPASPEEAAVPSPDGTAATSPGGAAATRSDAACFGNFRAVRQSISGSAVEYTIISGDPRGMFPLTFLHRRQGGRSYSLWKTLNGEVSGYALRDGRGFDFNRDRSYTGPLTWHPTQIFDRLFAEGTEVSGYNCLISGRSRISGYKTALLRFVPEDGMRYGFVVAYDEESMLPVELMITEPSGMLVYKISATSIKKAPAGPFPVTDEAFDRFEERQQQAEASARPARLDPWDFLVIPPHFAMTGRGVLKFPDGEVSPYQVFSDGLTDYRIYINSKSSLYLPAVSSGTLTVFRKSDSNREYAVTGEIPLVLAEEILSKVKGTKQP